MSSSTEHPQSLVIVYDQYHGCERKFYCDTELCNILYALNEIGVETEYSCQNLNNTGCIQIGCKCGTPSHLLAHARDLIVTKYPDKYVYCKLNSHFDVEFRVVKNLSDIYLDEQIWKFNKETNMPEFACWLDSEREDLDASVN